MNKSIEIELEFSETITEDGTVSLAAAPENVDDLNITVFDDQVLPEGDTKPRSTGLKQVHISGTPEALSELGRFLIAISESGNLPRDFITHLEPIRDSQGRDAVHLVVHHKNNSEIEPTIRVGDFIEVDEDDLAT